MPSAPILASPGPTRFRHSRLMPEECWIVRIMPSGVSRKRWSRCAVSPILLGFHRETFICIFLSSFLLFPTRPSFPAAFIRTALPESLFQDVILNNKWGLCRSTKFSCLENEPRVLVFPLYQVLPVCLRCGCLSTKCSVSCLDAEFRVMAVHTYYPY